uniref:Regulator of G-protein signaling 9 n=1 Tax=Culex pipiens TaxID=7175 RepID=A0A8D8FM75_CULPI
MEPPGVLSQQQQQQQSSSTAVQPRGDGERFLPQQHSLQQFSNPRSPPPTTVTSTMAAASVQQIPAAAATSQQQPLHNRLQLSTSLSASHSAGSHQSLLTTSPSANNQLGGGGNVQTGIERLSRPMAFDKMEGLVREMQDPEAGVPVRSQKLFLTSIPSAFMGYDLIEWLMERLGIEESEALNISNQLCMHGYFFPVSDTKTLVVKDDSSLYRFQTPYYWPWQQKAPDQIEYAIYLAKRSLRNKQRHGLEDYEAEALASLHKNLKGKWDFITMQAEEQVRLAKERKKGDKIVGDSQERAYWRVHRPPPGQFTPLESCPIPSRDRQGKPRKRTVEDWQREVEILKASLGRNRVKMSQACECNVAYYETFSEYDPMMNPPLPSNPWVTEDVSFWQMNGPVVEVPTEKRVKRWGISIEEVVSDPTGLQEFTAYLKKEYSHENIRFWMAVNDLRRSSHSQIFRKVKEIYEEFLEPGAPCEINIDGKTMEKVQQGLKNPSRFAFDLAAEHIYMLLLKKDCYPRFVRSEHYKTLMANAIQPSHKKRFFGFGGGAKKKGSTATAPNPSLLTQPSGPTSGNINSLSKRRGSDRSLSGSAHELAVCGVKDATKVPHSHSQSNLSDIPYREVTGKTLSTTLEVTLESGGSSAVCPWDSPTATAKPPEKESTVSVSVCPWDDGDVKLPSESKPKPPASDISEVSERMKRSCGLRQNTLDGDFHSTKRLAPVVTEQRRASMTMAPKLSDLQFSLRANSGGESPPGPPVLQQQRSFDHPRNVSQSSLSTSFEEREDSSATPTASDENLARQKKESISELEEPAEELGAAAGLGARASDVGEPTRTDVEMNTNITRASEQCTCQVATQTRTNITPVGGGGEVVNKSRAVTPGSEGQGLCVEAGAQRRGSVCEQPQPPTISVCFANSEAEEEERRRRRSLGNTGDRSLDEDHGEAEEVYFTSEEADEDAGSMGYTRLPDPPAPQDMSPLAEDDNFSESFSQPNQSSLEQVEYDIMMDGDNLAPGCVAPAPTPAPSIAPLAEVEMDPGDDEQETTASDHTETAVTVHVTTRERQEQEPEASAGATVVIIEDQVKRRKRKERKERGEKEAVQQQRSEEENSEKKGNAVCPWDDEDESAADEAPYVKTYSTLGYL